MTDKTLQDRLRQQAITADEFGYLDHARALNGAADALDAQAERIRALEGALRGFLAEFGDKATNANVRQARALLGE